MKICELNGKLITGRIKVKIKWTIKTILLIIVLTTIYTTTATATESALLCNDGDVCVNETGWWRHGSAPNLSNKPIQAAVDNAVKGETVCIAAGSYTENMDIATPHLTLRGAGADVFTVTAASDLDHIFSVNANYVNISGFTATGATGLQSYGIYLDHANHCNISENNCLNTDFRRQFNRHN